MKNLLDTYRQIREASILPDLKKPGIGPGSGQHEDPVTKKMNMKTMSLPDAVKQVDSDNKAKMTGTFKGIDHNDPVSRANNGLDANSEPVKRPIHVNDQGVRKTTNSTAPKPSTPMFNPRFDTRPEKKYGTDTLTTPGSGSATSKPSTPAFNPRFDTRPEKKYGTNTLTTPGSGSPTGKPSTPAYNPRYDTRDDKPKAAPATGSAQAAPAPAKDSPSETTPKAAKGVENVQNDPAFKKAFADARKKAGGSSGVFKWKGKEYQTNVKGEKYKVRSKLKSVNEDSLDEHLYKPQRKGVLALLKKRVGRGQQSTNKRYRSMNKPLAEAVVKKHAKKRKQELNFEPEVNSYN